MRSPASHILETALALRRAPGERFRLLVQPLPPGLVHVLEIAAAAPSALQAAAADSGESESVVLEAARFYLEQVLFAAPDADAYRLLGVAPDALDVDIRTHHRWLQRWLHPDRALAGDASVFATRVNQAWSQLRTQALRHEYDVRLAEARLENAVAPLSTATLRRWHDEEAVPRHGRRSRWLFAAALTSCAALAVLIVRHEDENDLASWDTPAADAVPTESAVAERSELDPLARALASPPPARPGARERRDAPPQVEASQVVAAATIAKDQGGPPAKNPAPLPRQVLPPILAGPRVASVPSARRPMPSPPGSVAMAPAPMKVVAVVTATPNPPAMAIATIEPVPPPPMAATPVAVRSEADPAVLLDRMRKAEQRVTQVAAYLAATPGAAPLWNDVRTQGSADRLRQQLAAGQGGVLLFAAPNWQLRPDNASFSGTYRCARCGIPEGRLNVQLIWREGLWLVRGVGLAPST